MSEQVKTLEGQCTQQGQELSDMQVRLTQEEHREEEMRKETFTLRQRVLESDAGREAALKEVQQQTCINTESTHTCSNKLKLLELICVWKGCRLAAACSRTGRSAAPGERVAATTGFQSSGEPSEAAWGGCLLGGGTAGSPGPAQGAWAEGESSRGPGPRAGRAAGTEWCYTERSWAQVECSQLYPETYTWKRTWKTFARTRGTRKESLTMENSITCER